MIKAIFFDVGGVLIRDDAQHIFTRQARILRIPRKLLVEVMRHDRRLLMKGRITRREYLRRLNIKFPHTRFRSWNLTEVFQTRVHRYVAVWSIAGKLYRNGYTVGIITNVFPPHPSLSVVRFPFPPFRPCIRSNVVGAAKPERRMYDIARKGAKVRFGEMVFFDDREENVAAAKKLGIKAFVYKNPTQLVRELRHLGVRIY